MNNDPNDLLMGGGAPSASFENIGDLAKGTIVRFESGQRRKFETNELMFWDDGKPAMQLIFTLQTDQRDPEDPEDEGLRRIYAPISSKPGSMCDAIRKAVRAAGAKQIAEGGLLAVQFTGEEAPEKRGRSPRKLYVAQYQPPSPAAAANDLLGVGSAPAAAAQPAAPAPAAAQPAADLLAPTPATGVPATSIL